jgi:hypothetical protein
MPDCREIAYEPLPEFSEKVIDLALILAACSASDCVQQARGRITPFGAPSRSSATSIDMLCGRLKPRAVQLATKSPGKPPLCRTDFS